MSIVVPQMQPSENTDTHTSNYSNASTGVANVIKKPWAILDRATPKNCYPCKRLQKNLKLFQKIQKILQKRTTKRIQPFQTHSIKKHTITNSTKLKKTHTKK